MEEYLLFNSPGYPILSYIMLMPLIGALVCYFLKGDLALKIWG